MSRLTIDDLKAMEPGEIFAKGYDNRQLWVAVRGNHWDWAIYASDEDMSWDDISRRGEKIYNESAIRSLVPCSEEAWKKYRQ